MATELDDPIRVGAIFSHGKVNPAWFFWNGREIRVRDTTFIWKTAQGSARIMHFSVSDGENLYELVFNQESLQWRLRGADDPAH